MGGRTWLGLTMEAQRALVTASRGAKKTGHGVRDTWVHIQEPALSKNALLSAIHFPSPCLGFPLCKSQVVSPTSKVAVNIEEVSA